MLHQPHTTNHFKGYFNICSTNLHRNPLWLFIKTNKHMLIMKNCCNSTWLFDQGINSPFVHGKRGYLFNCASSSWAPQFVLFPVMLHRVQRMSALPLILQELNLVRISQGFHQHKVNADTSLPVGNSSVKRLPGLVLCSVESTFWKLWMPFQVWVGLSEIKSQPFEHNAESIAHHWTTRSAKLCLCTCSLGWDLQRASAAAVRERIQAQAGKTIEGEELLLAVLFGRYICTGIGMHAQMCPYAHARRTGRQAHKDTALTQTASCAIADLFFHAMLWFLWKLLVFSPARRQKALSAAKPEQCVLQLVVYILGFLPTKISPVIRQ